MNSGAMDRLLLPRGADSYPRGTRVRVLRGDHKGAVGRVAATYADAGDMVHVVALPDGGTAEYDVAELMPLNDGLAQTASDTTT